MIVIWRNSSHKILIPELGLQKNGDYQLSEKQAQAILDLKLHRLTGLEKDKIFNEFNELLEQIKGSAWISLQNPDLLMQVIRDELNRDTRELWLGKNDRNY